MTNHSQMAMLAEKRHNLTQHSENGKANSQSLTA